MQKENIVNRDGVREFFKRWPQLYIAAVYVLGPTYLFGTGPRNFLKKQFPVVGESKVVNIGSGPTSLRRDVTNVDITPYQGVEVVASATELPFADCSVDGFICDNVLEHVDKPQQAVQEMYRVLRPGGIGYISTPFLYPFHASPYDYQRWTAAGLKELCKDFSNVEVQVRSGLFSTFNIWLCYLLPSLFSFGSDRLYWLLVNLSLFIFFPVKFLDIFANRLPFASHTAAVFCCIVRK